MLETAILLRIFGCSSHGCSGSCCARRLRSRVELKGKTELRGLEQMQFGGSCRVFRIGCTCLFLMLGMGTALAQYTQLGQALGSVSGQQSACSPTDPNCQPTDLSNPQSRIPLTPPQTPTANQGVVLSSQPETQNTTNNPNGNRTQQQLLSGRHVFHLIRPLSFSRWSRIRSGRCFRSTGRCCSGIRLRLLLH